VGNCPARVLLIAIWTKNPKVKFSSQTVMVFIGRFLTKICEKKKNFSKKLDLPVFSERK
jgi:hypothetical protein